MFAPYPSDPAKEAMSLHHYQTDCNLLLSMKVPTKAPSTDQNHSQQVIAIHSNKSQVLTSPQNCLHACLQYCNNNIIRPNISRQNCRWKTTTFFFSQGGASLKPENTHIISDRKLKKNNHVIQGIEKTQARIASLPQLNIHINCNHGLSFCIC